jgi:peptidoglycan/xylan/chitin deacetylase (PgdA/CDA1 family)
MEPGAIGPVSDWPGDSRGALNLTFDNLGEAAEIELGALEPGSPSIGTHFTASRVLPGLLDELAARGIGATFFVEGINAEHYPGRLAEIDAAGHELGYHAWRHETWADLSATEQAENLARGLAAFRGLGLEATGLRPPGGALGEAGIEVVRDAGLRYCSPAGVGAGGLDGVALVPFQWRHVDASCVLPPLGSIREQIAGTSDPIGPDAFLAGLEGELGRIGRDGGHLAIVLHLSMLDWFGPERLGALLDRVALASGAGDLWVARCAEVADHILANPDRFRDGTTLDPTSWSDPGG